MLLDYRSLIETETARRAATLATPIEVRAIRESAKSSLAAGQAPDAEAFAQSDALFHTSVSIAAHNVFLQSSVGNVRRFAAQSDVLLFHGDVPGSLEVAGHQHVAIADAVAAGEAERSAELMAEHIATTQHQFERKIRDRLFNLAGRHGTASAPSSPTPATPPASKRPSSPEISAS
jgi:DNA-binding FadR family transcriptional regulator